MRCGEGCGMELGHGFDDRWVLRCEEVCGLGWVSGLVRGG